MSITIYGFLGNELENIQERLINKFKALEFEIVLAPNTNLIFGVPDGLLNVKINRTPKNLRRISANTALAIQVDFHITPRANVTECDGEWPPDGVGDYTYEIFSRSASGRTNAHYYIQALIVVILASLTKGYSFFDDQDNACTGEDAVEGLIRSLNALEGRYLTLENQYEDAKDSVIRTAKYQMLISASPYFDEGACPFAGWESNAGFIAEQPIIDPDKSMLILTIPNEPKISIFMLIWNQIIKSAKWILLKILTFIIGIFLLYWVVRLIAAFFE